MTSRQNNDDIITDMACLSELEPKQLFPPEMVSFTNAYCILIFSVMFRIVHHPGVCQGTALPKSMRRPV